MTTIAENALNKFELAGKAFAAALAPAVPYLRNPETEQKTNRIVQIDGDELMAEEWNEGTLKEVPVDVDFYVSAVAGVNVDAMGSAAGSYARRLAGEFAAFVLTDAALLAATFDVFEGETRFQILGEPGTPLNLCVSLSVRLKIQHARNNPSQPAP